MPPVDEVPPLNNPAVVQDPVEEDEEDDEDVAGNERVKAEADDEFGVDFPSFISTSGFEEAEDVTDPVTSGGDAALYGATAAETPDADDGEGE